MIVAGVVEETVVVETVKVALSEPAGTVTDAGTVALGLLLASVTTAPPAGAPAVNVTLPVEATPPTTLEGVSVKEPKPVPDVTVRTAVRLMGPLP